MSFPAVWLFLVFAPSTAPHPNTVLTPAEVVRIVVDALRKVNSPIPNAGVYTTYQFASPANRAMTGPYGHFLAAVKNVYFAPLMHDWPSVLGPMKIQNNYAEQTVTIHTPHAGDVVFTFSLGRQHDGAYRGCWMVDGVGSSLQH